ncbi:MAG: hypothetical protein RL059_27 [Bacteroidota bacterium]|jgi:uncharacterized protein YukE
MPIDIAHTDPDAVQSMQKKVKKLQEELDNINKKLKGEVNSLHHEGFNDQKFVELENTMNLHSSGVLGLIKFMEKFSTYLREQEIKLRRYNESKKL